MEEVQQTKLEPFLGLVQKCLVKKWFLLQEFAVAVQIDQKSSQLRMTHRHEFPNDQRLLSQRGLDQMLGELVNDLVVVQENQMDLS